MHTLLLIAHYVKHQNNSKIVPKNSIYFEQQNRELNSGLQLNDTTPQCTYYFAYSIALDISIANSE